MPNNPPAEYTRVAIALHWVLAAALLAELVLGWWMLGVPKSPPGVRAWWFNLHKSIGLTTALFVLARMAWRTVNMPPPDDTLRPWERLASRLNHAILYLCMLGLPLTGYLGSTFTRYPVRWFGWIVPGWNHESAAGKEWMSVTHEALVWLFMAAVALHVLAAAWHWLRHDEIASRMAFNPRGG